MSTDRKHTDGELPDGWRMARLGDVAEIRFSNVDKRTAPDETPVRLCNYTDVFYNRRITADMDLMEASATDAERIKWQLRQGDVLFTKDSETPDEIGIPTLVAEDMPDVLCGYHLGLARPHDRLVEGSFLAIALASTDCRRSFARVANGVTRFGLTLGATESIPVVLPPLPEQRAIADVLDSIDDAIEHSEAVIAATETLRDSLLHELLARGVPGWHTEWKDVPGIGTIPADWEVVRLDEIADVVGGSTPSRGIAEFWDGTIPWVVPSELTGLAGRYLSTTNETITDAGMKSAGLQLLPAGSVLLTSRATVGAAAINLVPVVTNQGFQNLVVKHGTDHSWLYYRISSMRRELERRAAGSTFLEVSRDSVRSLPVALPPIAEQRAISATLDCVDNAIERARAERAALRSHKGSVADALLSGRVQVEMTRQRSSR